MLCKPVFDRDSEGYITYLNILFPLDFSKTAPLVAQHVASVAKNYGAQLHVIHVIPNYDRHVIPANSQLMKEITDRACSDMAEFVKTHFSGLNTITEVVTGHVGRQIVDYASCNDISLIIMGTHGRSELGQLVFGSVAQRVVQSATIPVMTINPACMQKLAD